MNNIYIFGGYNGKNCNNDMYVLETQTFNIIKINSNERDLKKRQRHTAALVNNEEMLIFAGYYGLQWYNNVDIINIKNLKIEKTIEAQNNTYTDCMAEMFNNKNFSDICFVVEGKHLFGHKSKKLYSLLE